VLYPVPKAYFDIRIWVSDLDYRQAKLFHMGRTTFCHVLRASVLLKNTFSHLESCSLQVFNCTIDLFRRSKILPFFLSRMSSSFIQSLSLVHSLIYSFIHSVDLNSVPSTCYYSFNLKMYIALLQ